MNGLGKELIGEWELTEDLVFVLLGRGWVVRHVDSVTDDLLSE